MFRLTCKFGNFTHKCVQCGMVVQYSTIQAAFCPICKAKQNLHGIDNTTSFPVHFIFDGDAFWRVWYQTSVTNGDLKEDYDNA